MRFSTAISLLSFTLGASAAALHKRDIDTGFWQIVAKPFGNSSAVGIPVIISSDPSNGATLLSSGSADETPLCIELTALSDWEGTIYKGAKVVNHPTVDEDIWMWKTLGAKLLHTSTYLYIAGTRGDWGFVNDPNSGDLLLDLNGDTVAKVSSGYVYFGSDIPAAEGGTQISLVGVSVEAC